MENSGIILDQAFAKTRIVVAANIAGIVALGGVIFLLHKFGPPREPHAIEFLRYLLGTMGIAFAVVALFSRIIIINAKNLGRRIALVRRKGGESAARAYLARMFYLGHVFPALLAEAVAFMGVIMYLVSVDYVYSLVLVAISLVSVFPHFPRKSVMEDLRTSLGLQV